MEVRMSEARTATGRLSIGPAGWSYRDWVGPVYPKGRRVDQLLVIASYFDCVELNSSFYRIPGRRLVESWAERLRDLEHFTFSIKVWQRYTHERQCDRADIERFIRSFESLSVQGRVTAFLLQFPWSFKNVPENREYLARLGRWFGDHPAAVEFRHGSWNAPDTLELLAESGLSFCNIDQPLIGNSLAPTEHVTDARLAYIRLHGRNRKSWFNESAGRDERYNYLYGADELAGWVERARRMLARVQHLFIITNNHYRGQALVNALQLKFFLEGAKPAVPPELLKAYPVLKRFAQHTPVQRDFIDEW
jgi:uncharacterized protein YecE (DUF72 family)